MTSVPSNYHTHHELCGHAKGRAEDYIKAAIAAGFEVLGFSDHAPTDLLHDPIVRMRHDQLNTYLQDIKHARAKYAEQIKVPIGLETEYYEPTESYYQHLLSKVDYLILGQHYVKRDDLAKGHTSAFTLKRAEDILAYANSVKAGLETGYYSLLAHPDLYMCGYQRFDAHATKAAHIIIDAAIAMNIPLEINAQGIRKGIINGPDGTHYKYPREEFFRLAKTKGASFMISSDSHDPDLLVDDAWDKAKAFAESLELNIIDYLPDLER